MKAMETLTAHLEKRWDELVQAKKDGQKIIGYTPGGFMPEELVLAAGAIPVGLIRGGEHDMVTKAEQYICHWFDTFCRAQIGYGITGKDPYYGLIDLLVVAMTDNHMRAVMDVLDYHTDIELYTYGVPHTKDELTPGYYRHGIAGLQKKLEKFTGSEITRDKLLDAITLCNRERELFREISLMRTAPQIPISSTDFVALMHASYLADKQVMVDVLEAVAKELKEHPAAVPAGPRVLLTGSTLARGDTKVEDLTVKSGGSIVVEEFAEGIRPYWTSVEPGDDLLDSLADAYFTRRVSPGWFRPSRDHLDFLVKLAKDFKVDGVIWYNLMFRECYKLESYYFPKILGKETGLQMIVLESDYDAAEIGQMETRIETFIESIRR